MKILFWGTRSFRSPLFGRSARRARHRGRRDPAGSSRRRGRELRASAVKAEALDQSFRILEPESARSDDFVEEISGLRVDLSVVVAYGQILSREVLDVPAQGSVNLHASLLPALRGQRRSTGPSSEATR